MKKRLEECQGTGRDISLKLLEGETSIAQNEFPV